MKVLLSGYFGFGNLGDELLLESEIGLLRKADFDLADIGILSADCSAHRENYGVRVFDRWLGLEMLKGVRWCDLLISGGGSLFQDSSSFRTPIYYGAVMLMAKTFGKSIITYGQGIGPLKRKTSRFITKRTIGLSKIVYVRDAESRAILREWKIESGQSPDPVFWLSETLPIAEGKVILLNLRPGIGDELIGSGLNEARKISGLSGCPIAFLAMRKEDIEIAFSCGFSEKDIFGPDKYSAIAGLSRAKHLIAARLHSLILAVCMGVDITPLVYDPKVKSFFSVYLKALEDGLVSREWAIRMGAEVERDFINIIDNFRGGLR